MSAPVDSNCHEREDTGRDCTRGNELSKATVSATEWPVVVDHIDEVKQRIEDGDKGVCNSEVHEEVVDDGTHALVCDHDPDDNGVSAGSDDDYEDKRDDVNEL